MTPNPFVLSYGEPANWHCPDCGVLFKVFPGLPFDRANHNCAKQRDAPKICPCWFRLKDHSRVESFVAMGLVDPAGMTVETHAPDGSIDRWERREENGLHVFYPPKHYRDAEFYTPTDSPVRGIIVRGGPHQILKRVPRPDEEKLALRNRHSVDLGRR